MASSNTGAPAPAGLHHDPDLGLAMIASSTSAPAAVCSAYLGNNRIDREDVKVTARPGPYQSLHALLNGWCSWMARTQVLLHAYRRSPCAATPRYRYMAVDCGHWRAETNTDMLIMRLRLAAFAKDHGTQPGWDSPYRRSPACDTG